MRKATAMMTGIALAIAMAIPAAAFYTRDSDHIFAMEMKFMFSCIKHGGSIDWCRAKLKREHYKLR